MLPKIGELEREYKPDGFTIYYPSLTRFFFAGKKSVTQITQIKLVRKSTKSN